MLNTQLHTLLQTIDKKEMRDFGYYLKGLYPRRKQLHKVHEYLAESHPEYEVERMNKELVIKSVFDKPPREKALSNLYVKLHKYLEDFLAIQELQNHSFIKEYLLIRKYERIKEEQLFFRHIQNARDLMKFKDKAAKKKGISNRNGIFYFLKSLILYHLKYFHAKSHNAVLNKDNVDVERALGELNNFYTLSKLNYETELLSRETVLNTNAGTSSKQSEEYTLLFNLFQARYQLISQPTDACYEQLFQLFFSNKEWLKPQELTSTLTYLCNYLISQIKQGREENVAKLFELYKLSYEEDVLIINDQLPSYHFHNIINISSNLGEFVWLDNFLINSQSTIPENSHELLKLGEAQLCFRKEKYQEVIHLIGDTKYKNPYFKFRSKSLLLRTYYKLNYPMDYILKKQRAFLVQVQRDTKMSPFFKKGYERFLLYFKDLYLEEKDKKALIHEMINEENLQCRGWLLKELGYDILSKKSRP